MGSFFLSFFCFNAALLGRVQAGLQRPERTRDSWGGPGTCMQVLDGNLISKQEIGGWESTVFCSEKKEKEKRGLKSYGFVHLSQNKSQTGPLLISSDTLVCAATGAITPLAS